MQHSWIVCFSVGLVLLAGCDSGPPAPKLTKVSGTVTLDGSPMAEGEVTFAEPAKGAYDSIKVIDGKFEGPVQPGKKRVEVRAYRPGKPNTEMYGPDAKAEPENYIPAKYNNESTMTAEIPESGASDLKYDVTSK